MRKDDLITLMPHVSGRGMTRNASAPFSIVGFLAELGSHILDTYLIVLIAMDGIIQGNLVIKEKNLIENIHFAIIDMYNENLLPSLQACLQVTIKTALHRFSSLGQITMQTYLNANGSRVSYFSGQMDQLKSVQDSIELVSQLLQYQPASIGEIERKVQLAIEQALVTHLTSRL